MRTLIRNATVVNADATLEADVLIDGDRIAEVAPGLTARCDRVLDATDRLVVPGGIDAHTHLDMPLSPEVTTSDDFASGTIAAAVGGTTCIVDYAAQARGGSLEAALTTWRQRAEGRAAIDYAFHMSVCDLSGGALDEMAALVGQGVTSFKVFMAYPGRLMLDDEGIARVMRRAAALGAMVCVHAEDGHASETLVAEARARGELGPPHHARTRPAPLETAAVRRVVDLARHTGCRTLVVHVSAGESAEVVGEARQAGTPVHGETCPQYLLLTDACYDGPGHDGVKYVISEGRGTAEGMICFSRATAEMTMTGCDRPEALAKRGFVLAEDVPGGLRVDAYLPPGINRVEANGQALPVIDQLFTATLDTPQASLVGKSGLGADLPMGTFGTPPEFRNR